MQKREVTKEQNNGEVVIKELEIRSCDVCCIPLQHGVVNHPSGRRTVYYCHYCNTIKPTNRYKSLLILLRKAKRIKFSNTKRPYVIEIE